MTHACITCAHVRKGSGSQHSGVWRRVLEDLVMLMYLCVWLVAECTQCC
jgi:hypothetical protein